MLRVEFGDGWAFTSTSANVVVRRKLQSAIIERNGIKVTLTYKTGRWTAIVVKAPGGVARIEAGVVIDYYLESFVKIKRPQLSGNISVDLIDDDTLEIRTNDGQTIKAILGPRHPDWYLEFDKKLHS